MPKNALPVCPYGRARYVSSTVSTIFPTESLRCSKLHTFSESSADSYWPRVQRTMKTGPSPASPFLHRSRLVTRFDWNSEDQNLPQLDAANPSPCLANWRREQSPSLGYGNERERRVAPVLTTFPNDAAGAPGPSPLGTGDGGAAAPPTHSQAEYPRSA
jgi:hypothetical protein